MEVIDHPEQFKEGVRILMRVLRNKDGGVGNVDRHSKKLVSRNPEEFNRHMVTLMKDIEPNERIYSTVDARNPTRAVRSFKQLQLDNDYSKVPEDFYLDIYNRWISALQQETGRATRLFLWDCDTTDEYYELLLILGSVLGISRVIETYNTKNGGHIITHPFEYPKLIDPKWHSIIKKNAMMLWAY